MAGWIVKLQNKPRAVRQRYAYGGSFVITALIVGIWFTTQSVPTLDPVAAATDQSNGAFSRFFDTVKGQTASVVSSFKGDTAPEESAPKKESPAATTSTSSISLPKITDETRAATEKKRTNTAHSTTTEAASSSTAPRAVMIATSSPKTAE